MNRIKVWTLIGLVVIASMLLAACQPQVQTVVTIVAGTPVQVVITKSDVAMSFCEPRSCRLQLSS